MTGWITIKLITVVTNLATIFTCFVDTRLYEVIIDDTVTKTTGYGNYNISQCIFTRFMHIGEYHITIFVHIGECLITMKSWCIH